MAERKIIAVVGATGAQGGGLVRAILKDGSGAYGVRALTRDTSSDKAKELASLGAKLVPADVDDAASLERAFSGAHGAVQARLPGAVLRGARYRVCPRPQPGAAKLRHVACPKQEPHPARVARCEEALGHPWA